MKLPPIKDFYNDMTEEEYDPNDYLYACQIWDEFECKTIDYSDIYLVTDVLLLCGVFEEFRKSMNSKFQLDPSYYVTIASYAFSAMMLYIKVELFQ